MGQNEKVIRVLEYHARGCNSWFFTIDLVVVFVFCFYRHGGNMNLDNWLASEGERSSFGGDDCTCEICGEAISQSEADDGGLCTPCICKVDDSASVLFSAPMWLIQDRMREYCDKYEWKIENKESK